METLILHTATQSKKIIKILFAAALPFYDFCFMRYSKILKYFYRQLSFLLLLLTTVLLAEAQFLPQQKYPQKYFQWPVDANIGLAANFGELRPNHYHMGLDCRSDQVVNKDVYAAADGYIAKIKVEPFGFGQAIYINHPNGMTTLYAHLNKFYPALEKYVEAQQYARKSWEVFLDIPANLFPVKQGFVIAKSGSTGGSQGPHVHFEVRDTKTDKVINPLLLGFPIQDNVAPDILRLAVYDRRFSTYEQTPKIYALKKLNGKYIPVSGTISVTTDKVSFAITAWDRYTGSTNQNGIYQAQMNVDGMPVSGFQLNMIGYDETRYINANIDYKTRSTGGPWLQHLSRLPGYNTGVYVTDKSDGVVNLEKGIAKNITIIASDPNGNANELHFSVVMNSINEPVLSNSENKAKEFHPGFINVFENDKVKFYLPENAIYDSFNFQYKEILSATGNNIFQLHTATVPLQTYFTVNIKGNFAPEDTGRIVMKRSYGSKTDYDKAVYHKGWYSASFREFGNYQLLKDDIPPVVTSTGFYNGMNASKLRRILFSVTDNSEDLSSFRALLDGEWLRFTNDKARNFIYDFDEHCAPGEHELVITAKDLVGNVTEKKYTFTR